MSAFCVEVVPPVADRVKQVFDQLAPAFAAALTEHSEKVRKRTRGPLQCEYDILLKVVRAEIRRCSCLKHQHAVAEGAARKRVAV